MLKKGVLRNDNPLKIWNGAFHAFQKTWRSLHPSPLLFQIVGLKRRFPTGFYLQSNVITQLNGFQHLIQGKWFHAADGLELRHWPTWPHELGTATCELIQSYLDKLPLDAIIPYQFGTFGPLPAAKENRLTFGQIGCFLSHLNLWYVSRLFCGYVCALITLVFLHKARYVGH